MAESVEPIASPEKPDEGKKPAFVAALNKAIKIAAFPISAIAGFWVMDSTARAAIIDIELDASETLKKEHDAYVKRRNALSNAVDNGTVSAAEALAKREANHKEWRTLLYENLEKKGFMGFRNFRNKFTHLRRVDQQKVLIEGVAVGSVILTSLLAMASFDLFGTHHDKKDDGPSR